MTVGDRRRRRIRVLPHETPARLARRRVALAIPCGFDAENTASPFGTGALETKLTAQAPVVSGRSAIGITGMIGELGRPLRIGAGVLVNDAHVRGQVLPFHFELDAHPPHAEPVCGVRLQQKRQEDTRKQPRQNA